MESKLDEPLKKLPLGASEVLREGSDLTILALGTMVMPAVAAAERLAEEGIDTRVVNARFVKPLDGEAVSRAATETGKLLIIEEGVLQGGFGSAVLEFLNQADIKATVKRLGVDDDYVGHGSQPELRAELGLDTDGIVKAAKELLGGSKEDRKVAFSSG